MKLLGAALLIAGLGVAVWFLLPPIVYRWSRSDENQIVVPFEEYGEITRGEITYSTSSLLNLVNQYRKEHNLNFLTVNEGLCRLAVERLEEIKTDWSHKGFFARNLYSYCPSCFIFSENLARKFTKFSNIVPKWDVSPSHSRVLNGSYSVGCTAQTQIGGKWWAVLEVGK